LLFSNYIDEKNVSLTEDALTIIENYIGKNYSFVISWISDVEQFREKYIIEEYDFNYWGVDYYEPFFMLGVSINFTTDKIYYPLKLTSIYGEEEIA